ncbi:MAG: hypothetical protein C5B52_14885 [Bacteroidetes bacterium]|nr:MAG: hypothetical protein C5B52_14885 [Bacteroidota bacterium]
MVVYRISKTEYAKNISGEGSKKFGGRWNHPGIACLYCAASRSLAVLEFSANVSLELLPKSLSIIQIEIPDDSWIEIPINKLPPGWSSHPSPPQSREFGTKLLTRAETLCIKIPSAIIPEEYNYLINPLHKDFGKVKVKSVEDFVFDHRVKE